MRKRIYIIIITLLAIVHYLNAGLYVDNKGKYGYLDESRAIDIPCKYDYMTEFTEKGVAIVQKRNKWGCIDENGKPVLKLKYLYISNFEDGFAKVSSEDGLGLINEEGEFVLTTQWGLIKPFNKSGIAIVGTKDGEMGVINRKGNIVCGLGKKISYYDSEYQRIDITPNMDTVPGFPEYFYINDSETFYYKAKGKFKYVRRETLRNIIMKAAFNCQGTDAMPTISGWSDFQDGIIKLTATVTVANSSKIGVAIAYYNIKEDKTVELLRFYKYKSEIEKGNTFKGTDIFLSYKFNCGYGCYTYIDQQGNTKSTIIDKYGKRVKYFNSAFGFNKNGYMIVKDSVNGKYGVVNTNFEYVINPEYDDVKLFRSEPVLPPYGKFLAKKDGNWGEIDINGKIMIPFKMKETFYSTADGLVGYSKDGEKFGLMNDNGKLITSCKFKTIYTSLSSKSVCGKLAGIGGKIYAYNLSTGDSTETGYDFFYDVIKAGNDYGGQIFILGTKHNNDSSYALIDGNLNLILDDISKKNDAIAIGQEIREKPFVKMSAIDYKRYKLLKSSAFRKYHTSDVVSESDWDY